MSRKYNCKHPLRGFSHYPERLAKRGLSKSPQLESLVALRARQVRRQAETDRLWPTSRSRPVERKDRE